jgi:hypothetical protein
MDRARANFAVCQANISTTSMLVVEAGSLQKMPAFGAARLQT